MAEGLLLRHTLEGDSEKRSFDRQWQTTRWQTGLIPCTSLYTICTPGTLTASGSQDWWYSEGCDIFGHLDIVKVVNITIMKRWWYCDEKHCWWRPRVPLWTGLAVFWFFAAFCLSTSATLHCKHIDCVVHITLINWCQGKNIVCCVCVCVWIFCVCLFCAFHGCICPLPGCICVLCAHVFVYYTRVFGLPYNNLS